MGLAGCRAGLGVYGVVAESNAADELSALRNSESVEAVARGRASSRAGVLDWALRGLASGEAFSDGFGSLGIGVVLYDMRDMRDFHERSTGSLLFYCCSFLEGISVIMITCEFIGRGACVEAGRLSIVLTGRLDSDVLPDQGNIYYTSTYLHFSFWELWRCRDCSQILLASCTATSR